MDCRNARFFWMLGFHTVLSAGYLGILTLPRIAIRRSFLTSGMRTTLPAAYVARLMPKYNAIRISFPAVEFAMRSFPHPIGRWVGLGALNRGVRGRDWQAGG